MPNFKSWLAPRNALSKGAALSLALYSKLAVAQSGGEPVVDGSNTGETWSPKNIAIAVGGFPLFCCVFACIPCACRAAGNGNVPPAQDPLLPADVENQRNMGPA